MQDTLAAAQATAESAAASAPASAEPGWLSGLLPEGGIWSRLFTLDTALKAARVGLTIVVGLVLLGLVVSILKRLTRRRMDSRSGALVVRLVQYLGLALILINAFEAAAVDLSALLGAAGIAGIALGFAAQTSVSNFISGFFLMSEKTFAVGDVINVDGKSGVVHSIDALSVKLRTFDNQLVRIPNETLIKTNVANLTRFPARRLNIDLVVPFGTDIEKARAAAIGAMTDNRWVLRNPEPFFMVQRFGDRGIELFLGAWLAQDDWVAGTNGLYAELQSRLAAAGIEPAYPAVNVHAGEALSAPAAPSAGKPARPGKAPRA